MPERFNPQLTQSDQALFITAMMCAPGGLVNVKVDYKRLADAWGFKNSTSANAAWCALRKKIMVIADHHAGDESVPATPKKTPNRVTKKTPKSTKKAENWKSDVSAMLASDDELSSSKKELLKKEVDEALEEF